MSHLGFRSHLDQQKDFESDGPECSTQWKSSVPLDLSETDKVNKMIAAFWMVGNPLVDLEAICFPSGHVEIYIW